MAEEKNKKTNTKNTKSDKTQSEKKVQSEKKEVKEETKKTTNASSNKTETKDTNTKIEKTFSGLDFTLEAVLVYILPILGFIFSFMDSTKYSKRAKFMYNQTGAVFIVNIFIGILFNLAFLGIVFKALALVLFIFDIIALIKACQGEDFKIPLVYNLGNFIWNSKSK